MGNRVGLWAGLLALTAGVGCSDDAPQPRLEVVSGENSVEVEVGRAGAVLELEDRARVTIPPGALDMDTMIQVRLGKLKDLPRAPDAAFEELGRPVIVEPHGLRLNKEASIEIAITDEDTRGKELRTLRLEDEQDRSWEELGSVRVAAAGSAGRALSEYDVQRSARDSVTTQRRLEFSVKSFSVFLAARTVTLTGDCAGMEAGDVCRPSAGLCDTVEVCDGDSPDCPADDFEKQGVECRPAELGCDIAEVCDGDHAECPADEVVAAQTECRAAVGPCDSPEECDGEAAGCPADSLAPAGTACDDGLFCTLVDSCDGMGGCAGAGDPCTPADGDADCNEACDEAAADCSGIEADGTACMPSACAEGSCNSGSCDMTVSCPVFVALDGADGNGCGTDWATACATPQGGSDEAVRTGNARVFVRDDTFVAPVGGVGVLSMAANVAYYGGFGGTENLLSERVTPAQSRTVLDGNSTAATVVTGASGVRLDGFDVRNGMGASGAGMRNTSISNLTIIDSRFVTNITAGAPQTAQGGGVFNDQVTAIRFERVAFEGNEVRAGGAVYGGAMANVDSSVTLVDVQFVGNQADLSSSFTDGVWGGALYDNNTQNTLTNVTFESNLASGFTGAAFGGAYAIRNSVAGMATSLEDVHFVNNVVDGGQATHQGAGLYVRGDGTDSSVQLRSVGFRENIGAVEGGGMYLRDADLIGEDVGFYQNSASPSGFGSRRGGGLALVNGSASLTDVQFRSNNASASSGDARGAGLYATGTDVDIANADFIDNGVGASGSGAVAYGAGIDFGSGNTLTATDVSFVSNFASGVSGRLGAALHADGGNFTSIVELSSATFVDNNGDMIWADNTNLTVTNAAVRHASGGAEFAGGGSYTYGNICSEVDPGSGSYTAISDGSAAFEVDPSLFAYLDPSSECVDTGSDADADAAFGARAEWRARVTQENQATDIGQADHGRHYATGKLRIRTLDVDSTDVSWVVVGPLDTACYLKADGFDYNVPASDISSGTTSHPVGNTTFTLRCQSGGQYVRAMKTTVGT